jgi:hypothetical protein
LEIVNEKSPKPAIFLANRRGLAPQNLWLSESLTAACQRSRGQVGECLRFERIAIPANRFDRLHWYFQMARQIVH